MFDWDEGNLRKIRRHRIKRDEVEFALSNNPLLISIQEVSEEVRYVYYGETEKGRMLGIIVTERQAELRVITSYDLDAWQRRDYLARRIQEQ